MIKSTIRYFAFTVLLSITACGSNHSDDTKDKINLGNDTSITEYGSAINIAAPMATQPRNKYAKVLGWADEQTPKAPAGYKVVRFANELNSPRNIYAAPNGDIFIAEARTEKSSEDPEKAASRNAYKDKSSNRIMMLRDSNHDGRADERFTFLENLKQPFGMLILNNFFYVANTDGVWRYPYAGGEKKMHAKGEKILNLPAGGYNNHWTRNLTANEDGSKIYVAVGSSSNIAENGIDKEKRRANILEINPDGTGEHIYAAGLRNPVGMDWEPVSKQLWTAVNERDGLGDQIVPDYITNVRENGFYGWPYAYWGKNPDPRLKGERKDLIKESIIPDFALGAHTASLGLAFSKSEKFKSGAYIGQHGSWNRSNFSGYKVLFIPFNEGSPTGEQNDFLTGFIADETKNEVYGRPVSVTFTKQGYMLVADDAGNTVWAVMKK